MPPRHSLLWLTPSGWAAALPQVAPTHQDILHQWRDADRPVIMRRQEIDCDEGQICIGLACPPDPITGNKLRLPLRVAQEGIDRFRTALTLAEVMPILPAQWHPSICDLQAEAAAHDLPLQVFGSAALQSITGLTYLRAASDLDLLVLPTSLMQVDLTLGLLMRYGDAMPLDGEIQFPSGAAVAWKELAAARYAPAATRVLAKLSDSVTLIRIDALLAQLEPVASAA